MEKEEFLKKYMPYIKWGIIAVVAVIFMFTYEKPFSQEGTKEIVSYFRLLRNSRCGYVGYWCFDLFGKAWSI